MKSRIKFIDIFGYVMLLLGAAIVLVPFLWTLSTAFKHPSEVFTQPAIWIPKKLMWVNFKDAVNAIPFWSYLLNTIKILIPVMIGVLFSSSLVAYGFARLRFPGKNALFFILLATMMLPGQVTMIPTFLMFKSMGWTNSFKPLIIPAFFGGGAFNIFLLRQYMLGIPYELDEAAIIDGANRFTIYYKIILPLVKPALAAIAIFCFMGVWNDYQGPLIYLNNPVNFTLALGLTLFKGMYTVEWNMLMAATVLVMLPVLIVFFIFQRYFIEGVTLTGLKG